MTITLFSESHRQQALTAIKDLSLEVPMTISITEYRKNRSLAQNRLLHLWLNEITKHWQNSTGQHISMDAWKEYLKRLYLGYDVSVMPGGSCVELTRKTSKLNTKEFNEFLELVDAYAATELELILPHPDDLYLEAFGVRA
jgi:hypothetical protein